MVREKRPQLASPEVPFARASPNVPSSIHEPVSGNSLRIGGFPLFFQQLIALVKKNALLSRSNKRATILQLAASLIFIFLIFCVEQATDARNKKTTGFRNLYDPDPSYVPGIRACEAGYYIKPPCFDFVWSSNASLRARTIAGNIMKNNPGRPIGEDRVLSFESIDDVNKWLLENPMRTTGALHFQERSATVIAYGIQTNSTPKQVRGQFEDPTFTFQIPLQLAAEREISRLLIGDSSIGWSVAFKEFAHPSIQTFSVAGTVGPIFLLAATMFGFVMQISSLVTERELKLRQAMSTMGLLDSAYWLSWLLWELALILNSSLLIVLFGMMFQFDLFLHNNFGILFFLLFLFQLNMTGFAFLLSTFVSNSGSARTVGFSVFIIGFLTQLVTAFGFPYDKRFQKSIRSLWSIFPPNLFAIGMNYLGDATSTKEDKGISWSGRKKCASNSPNCVITTDEIYQWFIATFFVWFFLALYFDNVLKDANGVSQPWYYFLMPTYWIGTKSNQSEGCTTCCCCGEPPAIPPEISAIDEDVAAEERYVQEQVAEADDANIAVKVCGLVKTFPGTRGCCSCKALPAYHAVKNLWVHIEKDKLFCLLGPNGAGKTTTINCLTGIIPVTSGDALVYGDSIRSPNGMAKIRSYMGVCPQFNVLWDGLTGLEHLNLFAKIKGLPSSMVKQTSEELLSQVKLADAVNMKAGSYSGGMKRRLSVAIALIGDPKIVYLDEPTTGMDPITRRNVWDIIEGAKKGRAIILTTHSMEEADILSDRIAIMAKGRLRCIGTSLYLKSRFGSGYVVSVSLDHKNNAQEEDGGNVKANGVKYYFKEHLEVLPKEENESFLTFVIPREKERQMMEFFKGFEGKEAEFGIADIQVSLTTLEEVFLNIAKKAELESAAAEGRYETVVLPDGQSLQVPLGASLVAIPGTETNEHPQGMMIELQWQQDEAGRLCLASQSEPVPLPLTATQLDGGISTSSSIRTSSLASRSASRSRRAASGRGVPVGRVLEL